LDHIRLFFSSSSYIYLSLNFREKINKEKKYKKIGSRESIRQIGEDGGMRIMEMRESRLK